MTKLVPCLSYVLVSKPASWLRCHSERRTLP
jgi:hypothetical protein